MPGRFEPADFSFLFEPTRERPLPDQDGSIPMSQFTCRPPPTPLAAFVDRLWFYRCEAPVRIGERAMPTGTMGLVVDLRSDSPGPSVLGAYSEALVLDERREALSAGVCFKPGGAFPFLGSPADELLNARAPLERFWGSRALALQARLLRARSPASIFDALERAMMAQVRRPPPQHPAVAFALGEFQSRPQISTVGEVIRQVGLSPRAFIRRFAAEVGLTPKLFCRIRRFQQALRLARDGRPSSWAHVALDCGYYDQAHFIRDFRAFSGFTPTAFLGARTGHLDYGARWTRSFSSKTACCDSARMASG
jgi:AraC-like DNA-binding protein